MPTHRSIPTHRTSSLERHDRHRAGARSGGAPHFSSRVAVGVISRTSRPRSSCTRSSSRRGGRARRRPRRTGWTAEPNVVIIRAVLRANTARRWRMPAAAQVRAASWRGGQSRSIAASSGTLDVEVMIGCTSRRRAPDRPEREPKVRRPRVRARERGSSPQTPPWHQEAPAQRLRGKPSTTT